jgi:hypothetical protein
VTNSPAYYGAYLIASVKSFIVYALGNRLQFESSIGNRVIRNEQREFFPQLKLHVHRCGQDLWPNKLDCFKTRINGPAYYNVGILQNSTVKKMSIC